VFSKVRIIEYVHELGIKHIKSSVTGFIE